MVRFDLRSDYSPDAYCRRRDGAAPIRARQRLPAPMVTSMDHSAKTSRAGQSGPELGPDHPASWEARLLTLRADLPAAVGSLALLARRLLASQTVEWPALALAVTSLKSTRFRQLSIQGAPILVQFNPHRRASTTAQVDPQTIDRRPCPLCPVNMPAAERGIPFGAAYAILCNPFPVLPDHLVIASREHRSQEIAPVIGDLLDLAHGLGESLVTLYNGPRCGASVPDHLHFQAAAAVDLPLLAWIEHWTVREVTPEWLSTLVRLSTPSDHWANLLIFESRNRDALVTTFTRALKSLAEVTAAVDHEPLINLIVHFRAGKWCLIVIPRSRHRPGCFEAEGAARLTVSPGTIDLGGVFVMPHQDEFERITAPDLAQICREVTLDDQHFAQWLESLLRH